MLRVVLQQLVSECKDDRVQDIPGLGCGMQGEVQSGSPVQQEAASLDQLSGEDENQS